MNVETKDQFANLIQALVFEQRLLEKSLISDVFNSPFADEIQKKIEEFCSYCLGKNLILREKDGQKIEHDSWFITDTMLYYVDWTFLPQDLSYKTMKKSSSGKSWNEIYQEMFNSGENILVTLSFSEDLSIFSTQEKNFPESLFVLKIETALEKDILRAQDFSFLKNEDFYFPTPNVEMLIEPVV